MLKNVIFDWSGTLVDDLGAVWRTTNHVLRMSGMPEMALDTFRAEFCLPFHLFYERYTPEISKNDLEKWFHAEFPKWEHLIQPQPFAHEFLKYCRCHGLKTFVLSTIKSDHFTKQADRFGLSGLFDQCYLDVLDKRKRIHEILDHNHLHASETCFIGDMQHDIETAKHGGTWSCAVLTGYNLLRQLRLSKPHLIVAHLGELQVLLETNHLEWPSSDHRGCAHPIATVGALIFNDLDQMLLVQTAKWSNLWGIPGGKIKYGESAEEALERETREETGLSLNDIRFVMVQDCVESEEFYRREHFLLLNYTARCADPPQVRLNHEAYNFEWVDWNRVQALALNQPTRYLIDKVRQLRRVTSP